ncbi:MAG: hypothetical protein HOP27_02565 [Anaerolineales bacterium]|nr:hypothetical protein [Anaerolineales bacterium]
MRYFLTLCLLSLIPSACAPSASSTSIPTPVVVEPSPIFTAIPTFTPTVSPTSTPIASLGTIALDFTALLCNAEWMNGAHKLTPCPPLNADLSGGYAATLDPRLEGLPANVPALLIVPTANAFFLRYPSFTVGAKDRFRATLQCPSSMPCDVQFALEYYDANGKYHEFMAWDYKAGEDPINVDADLSSLTGQSVDFVLTLRLFHAIENTQQDNGIWIAPHIYRPMQ